MLRTIVKLFSHCAVFEVHKLPYPVLTFFVNLPTVIYSHPSHGSSTTQCSCLISDSVNPFPLRLMSHEFTLLTPLHRFSRFTLSPYPPSVSHHYYSKSHRGTQGRNRLQYKRPFSASRLFLAHSLQSPAFSSLLCRVSSHSAIFSSTEHKHNNF